MGDALDHHTSGLIIDGVDHAITARTDTIGVVRTGEFFSVKRSRRMGQRFDGLFDMRKDCGREMTQLPHRRGRVEHVIQRYLAAGRFSETWTLSMEMSLS